MKKTAKAASILTLATGISAASAAGITPLPETHAQEAVKIDDLYSMPLWLFSSSVSLLLLHPFTFYRKSKHRPVIFAFEVSMERKWFF